MSLLRSWQTVLDVQQGLCALAIQNFPPFVGFRNCLAYSSLADIFCWILIVHLTSESPNLHMHRIVLIQTQGDPYAYFWISFWAHFPLLRCSALQFKWHRPPWMLIYFLNSWNWKTLLGFPSLFHIPENASRLEADYEAHLICLPSLMKHNSILCNVFKKKYHVYWSVFLVVYDLWASL